MVGILETLADFIEKNASVKCLIEPQPIALNEPHLRLSVQGLEFEWLDETGNYEADQFVEKIGIQGTLLAAGDGPGAFLDKVLKASFNLNLLFRRPFSVSLVNNAGYFTVSAKSKGGSFYSNDEGAKTVLYKEVFEMAVFLPYAIFKKGGKA